MARQGIFRFKKNFAPKKHLKAGSHIIATIVAIARIA